MFIRASVAEAELPLSVATVVGSGRVQGKCMTVCFSAWPKCFFSKLSWVHGHIFSQRSDSSTELVLVFKKTFYYKTRSTLVLHSPQDFLFPFCNRTWEWPHSEFWLSTNTASVLSVYIIELLYLFPGVSECCSASHTTAVSAQICGFKDPTSWFQQCPISKCLGSIERHACRGVSQIRSPFWFKAAESRLSGFFICVMKPTIQCAPFIFPQRLQPLLPVVLTTSLFVFCFFFV